MTGARWSGWGVSIAGPEHRRTGLPNQDAWALRRYPAGLAVAVSDGLGSCRFAEVGARAACRAVLEAAATQFRASSPDLSSLPRSVGSLWGTMLSGRAPGDCSATCLFVAVGRAAGTLLAQLGDGLIAACRPDGTVDLLMPDKEGSFANLTVGLASADADDQWRTSSVPSDRYSAFVLCTDGIADDLAPDAARAFAWEVSSHYRHVPDRQRCRDAVRWLRRWPVPGDADDKTIACVYRDEAL